MDPRKLTFMVENMSAAIVNSKNDENKKFNKGMNHKTKTAREILDMKLEPINYIIPDFLVEGYAILAGRPKIGKSWIGLNLAISIAFGTKAFNYFNTVRSKILYIAYEDGERRLNYRIRQVLKGMEINENSEELSNIIFKTGNIPKFVDGGLEEIKRLLDEDSDIKLVIVDTLKRAIMAKKGRSDVVQEDYDFGAKIQTLAESKSVAILAIHHTTKAKYDDIFDSISGTTGVTAAADSLMVFTKQGKSFLLSVTGRDISENTYLMNLGDNGIWKIERKDNEISKTTERNEIIDLFRNSDNQLDYNCVLAVKDIVKRIGKEQSNVSHLVSKLKEEGILKTVVHGKYKLVEKKF